MQAVSGLSVALLLFTGCFVVSLFALMPGARAYSDQIIGHAYVTRDTGETASELASSVGQNRAGYTGNSITDWAKRSRALPIPTMTEVNVNAAIGTPVSALASENTSLETTPATSLLKRIRVAESREISSSATRSWVASAMPDLLWSENFDDPASAECQTRIDTPEMFVGCVEGQLSLAQLKRERMYVMWRLGQDPPKYADTALIVDARLVGGVESRRIGIGCRDQGPETQQNYQLIVAPAVGEAAIFRENGLESEATNLTGWQSSPAIHRSSGTNQLALTCSGSTISAAINGTSLFQISDATYQAGYMFFYVESNADVAVEGRFDSASITER